MSAKTKALQNRDFTIILLGGLIVAMGIIFGLSNTSLGYIFIGLGILVQVLYLVWIARTK
jgi:hypothetical protein